MKKMFLDPDFSLVSKVIGSANSGWANMMNESISQSTENELGTVNN